MRFEPGAVANNRANEPVAESSMETEPASVNRFISD